MPRLNWATHLIPPLWAWASALAACLMSGHDAEIGSTQTVKFILVKACGSLRPKVNTMPSECSPLPLRSCSAS